MCSRYIECFGWISSANLLERHCEKRRFAFYLNTCRPADVGSYRLMVINNVCVGERSLQEEEVRCYFYYRHVIFIHLSAGWLDTMGWLTVTWTHSRPHIRNPVWNEVEYDTIVSKNNSWRLKQSHFFSASVCLKGNTRRWDKEALLATWHFINWIMWHVFNELCCCDV